MTDGAAIQLEWLEFKGERPQSVQYARALRTAIEHYAPELLVCVSAPHERPFHGVLEIADWRLAGKLSQLALRRKLTGSLGEALLFRSEAGYPYRNILVVGRGEQQGALSITDYLRAAIGAAIGLRVASVALESAGIERGTLEAALAQEITRDERASASKWLAVTSAR